MGAVVVTFSTPALDEWRRELAAGWRTPHTFDALWRAACEEMNALDALRDCPELVAKYSSDAQTIVKAALSAVSS